LQFFKNIGDTGHSDDELVHAYKTDGNVDVLSDLYQRYIDLVYGVCLKYLKEPEDAQDAVMSIFEDLIVKLHKYDVTYFRSWLYQVATNHCLMLLRSRKKFSKVNIDVSLMQNHQTVHLNGELEKEENLKHLNFCLGQLSPEQRKVVELFYIKGKCYKEIVDDTGMEWDKVRSFIQNGRRNLKLCMDKQLSS
jgi:RNA polymerase sigma-70 factor (ECF subfamily)